MFRCLSITFRLFFLVSLNINASERNLIECPSTPQSSTNINEVFPMWSKGFSKICCCDIFPDKIISNGIDYFEHASPLFYFSNKTFDEHTSQIRHKDIVYVPSADLPYFITKIFIHLQNNYRIIIVSGCEDIGVPYELFHPNRTTSTGTCADFHMNKMWPDGQYNISMLKFIMDDRLARLYTQNYDGVGCNSYSCSILPEDMHAKMTEKVVPIPIGLDLHGQLAIDEPIPKFTVDSFSQFRDLLAVRLLSLPLNHRLVNDIVVSFDCNIGECRQNARGEICDLLKQNQRDDLRIGKDLTIGGAEGYRRGMVHLTDDMIECAVNSENSDNLNRHLRNILNDLKRMRNSRPMRRLKFWVMAAISPFTIAPAGGGLDTHRLWEALQMGSIPITLTSTLDRLYTGYPIVILNHWSELFEDGAVDLFRKNIRERFGDNPFNETMMRKLSIWHWKQVIQDSKELISA